MEPRYILTHPSDWVIREQTTGLKIYGCRSQQTAMRLCHLLNIGLLNPKKLYDYCNHASAADSLYRTLKDDYIIFLDFDGVLNHQGCKSETDFLPEAVMVLNKLYTEYRAKIVISSSWKDAYTFSQLASLLSKKGVLCEVIDKTPTYVGPYAHKSVSVADLEEPIGPEEGRNKEILTYIRVHGIQHYLILDDMAFSNQELISHHCQTCWFDTEHGGLRLSHLDTCRKILNR